MAKLNQIVAVEKSTKSKAHSELSELYKVVQKPALFNGFNKTYRKIDEGGEDFSPETAKVQKTVSGVINSVKELMTELFDVTATKDFGNLAAKADVVVDGAVILASVPVPYLLFLEKQLTDLSTFVSHLPILDDADSWKFDTESGHWVTDKFSTHRTKKVQKGIVLYDATDKHPAQTQLISDDVLVGYWDTVKRSGAVSRTDQEKLQKRIKIFSDAVKFAREEANSVDVSSVKVADKIFSYLFN